MHLFFVHAAVNARPSQHAVLVNGNDLDYPVLDRSRGLNDFPAEDFFVKRFSFSTLFAGISKCIKVWSNFVFPRPSQDLISH